MTAPSPHTFPSRAAERLLGAPREVRIPRNGDRDLWFEGWCLGHAEGRKGHAASTSGVDVDIYLTVGKRLVAHVCQDRKSTRLNSSHLVISYAVFCLKKKKITSVTRSSILTQISAADIPSSSR